MRRQIFIVALIFSSFGISRACSIFYFIDAKTGKIYIANNEDYWLDTRAYIKVIPESKDELSRLWFGWKNFGQGGINQAGLFLDGAVTPKDSVPSGYGKAKGNLTDRILAQCKTVNEAIAAFEKEKVALNDAHVFLGDSTGNAAVIEWIKGKRVITRIKNNRLVATNFHLADTTTGNYPCYRFKNINKKLDEVESLDSVASFLQVANCLSVAAQPPLANMKGRLGGTLYSVFIDVSEMKFVLSPKLRNTGVVKLDLNELFDSGKKKTIRLSD